MIYTQLNIYIYLILYDFEVDCVWNDWEIGECSLTCGGGIRIDTRTKKVEESIGGTCEPSANQRASFCNTDDCPGNLLLIV